MRGRRGLIALIAMLATVSGCGFNNDYVVKKGDQFYVYHPAAFEKNYYRTDPVK